MRARYPHERTETLARDLGRTCGAVYQRADRLRLAKSAAYLASPAACRTNGRQGMGTRFQKGSVPANKGLRGRKGWAPGRMAEGQFKPGVRTGEYLDLTAPRLRAMERWADDNPPESGIVSVQRDPHGRFWQGVALKAAADAAVTRVGGKA